MSTNHKTAILNKINTESKKIQYTELYGNDILFTIIAIIITIIITIYFVILINFKKYHKAWKDNENNIRCNPVFMPFSKYISSGPLFGNAISGSENLKFCVDNISGNVSSDYSADFTGVFKYIDGFYNLITDSIITLKLMLATLLGIFMQITKIVMKKFNILSDTITTLIHKTLSTFNIFPFIFLIIFNIIISLINVIKYILICLINLLYRCVLGPVASLVQLLSIWGVLLIVLFLISFFLMLGNLPFGIWPVYLALTILCGVLIALLVPVSAFTSLLFIILLTIINKLNEKVMGFLDGLETGLYINHNRHDYMRSSYINKKENEASDNLFSPPNFNDCKKVFENK